MVYALFETNEGHDYLGPFKTLRNAVELLRITAFHPKNTHFRDENDPETREYMADANKIHNYQLSQQ
jgi:hypothetical protein